ncbi:MAG TPA: hypothetical protein VFX16_19155 [Pseudonocardiaceae bacterium]|nr:hypothetical protein [Pseudonocardiaceae bacterium]
MNDGTDEKPDGGLQLLRWILDDDRRTARTIGLILTVALAIFIVLTAVGLVVAAFSIGAGGTALIGGLAALRRTRRRRIRH